METARRTRIYFTEREIESERGKTRREKIKKERGEKKKRGKE